MEKFYGLQKISLVDFDGHVTCTIFSGGCNFRCPWCHNAHLVEKKIPPISFEEIYTYLNSRKNIIDAVCISGGEPTLMPNLKFYLKKIKSLNFLIKLDTNGSMPDVLNELIAEKLIDYVAMDIKGGSNYPFITASKVNFENIYQSIQILKKNLIPFEFRTTLINEFHDWETIKEIGELIKGDVNLFLQKFIDRDSCFRHEFHEVPKEKALVYKDFLKNYVKNVQLRGY